MLIGWLTAKINGNIGFGGDAVSKENMDAFIHRVANDEVFRADLIADPPAVLGLWNLSDEELHSIKRDDAWGWLRALWDPPEGWQC